MIEKGWTCSGGTTSREDVCTPQCGDWTKYFREHCEDGNTVSGDGCDANCITEPGWSCTGGYHHGRDNCTTPCGDGRNIGYHVCDDGNTISGDGCAANCTLEPGMQCMGGSAWTPDHCREVCGDGKNMGTVQCDDGNLLNGDGCDSVCDIEDGFYCFGPYHGKDHCYENCGDGVMNGWYPCDDGNLVNGDGCSSVCTIETCWSCTFASPSVCTIDPINSISAINVTMAEDQSSVTIMLNNTVILDPSYMFDLYKAITVDISGPLAPYNYTWQVENLNLLYQGLETDSFKIDLNYQDTRILGSN